jgi:cardiolipin synthase
MRRAVVFLATVLLAAAGCARVTPHLALPPLALGEPSFFPTLEAYANAPIVGGNRVDILLNGEEIFPAKLDAIRAARRSITMAEYFYAEGPVARLLAEALAERCRAGIPTHVLLDGFGTLAMRPEDAETMKAAGCQVVTFRPIGPHTVNKVNNRNHRRILVVDGRVGFTGGSGVGRQWMGNGRIRDHWRDTDVAVRGPVVQYLQGAFAEHWLEATGVVLGGEPYFPRVPPSGPVHAQVLKSSPAGGGSALYTALLLAIASARRSILITNPYFLPDFAMQEALAAAARRGVRVAVLAPSSIDSNLVRAASRRQYGPLLRAGVQFYEYQPALLHAKTMVIDGVWATVGSANLDNRSFALNDELNVITYDRGVAARLEAVFAADLAHATPVTYEAWRRRPVHERLLELLSLPIQDGL